MIIYHKELRAGKTVKRLAYYAALTYYDSKASEFYQVLYKLKATNLRSAKKEAKSEFPDKEAVVVKEDGTSRFRYV